MWVYIGPIWAYFRGSGPVFGPFRPISVGVGLDRASNCGHLGPISVGVGLYRSNLGLFRGSGSRFGQYLGHLGPFSVGVGLDRANLGLFQGFGPRIWVI